MTMNHGFVLIIINSVKCHQGGNGKFRDSTGSIFPKDLQNREII